MTRFYTLTLNQDRLLYDSRIVVPDESRITDCHNIQLQRGVNTHGKLDFTLPFTHPLYLDASNPTAVVRVDQSDRVAPFTGILLRTKTIAMGVRTFTYAGMSILLTRIKQRPFTYTGPLRGFLEFLLTRHNQAAGPGNTWTVGLIAGFNPTAPVDVTVENPTSTWDVLIKILTGDEGMGGYLLPRVTDAGNLVLDVSNTSGPLSNQSVTLTSNVIDFDAVMDLSTVTTRLYPLGATVETTTNTGAPDGAGAVSTTERERVTITAVNNGVDYLQDDTLVGLLGVREETVTFDKADNPYDLKMLAAQRLATMKLAGFTARLTVADLSLVDVDYDGFTCGDQVLFGVPEFGLSETAIITDTTTRIDDPVASSLTIGAEQPTLITSTRRTADQVTRIATSTARLDERMVSVSSNQAEIQAVLTTTREAVAAAEARSAEDRKIVEAARRDADQARRDAEEAVRRAAMAAGVVEGKVEFWTEPVTPPVEYQCANVLWIDAGVDGVTILRRWDGTVWSPIQDPAALEAAVLAEAAEDRANASAQAAQAAQAEAEASSSTAVAAKRASEAAQASAQASASSASEAQALASSAQQAATEAKIASSTATADAVKAKAAADQAAQDAADAAGLANGKSDVVIQLDPPGVALRKATTLWIDTTGGANTPKKWSGSAWVAVTDKTATDAASAAVAAKTSAEKAQSTADSASLLASSAQTSADVAQSYASAAGMGGANVVIDPSFEDPTVWATRVGSSGLTFDTSDAHTGTQCGRIPAGKYTRKLSMTPTPIPVQPGQVWRIKAWMKSSSDLAGATDGSNKIRLAKADDSWVGAVATNTVGTQWTAVGWDTITIPAGVTRLDVQVWADFTAGCQWIDDLEIVNITDAVAVQKKADAAQAKADMLASATFDSAPDVSKPGHFLRAVYLNQKKGYGSYVPSYRDILGLQPDLVDTIPESKLTGTAANWNIADYYIGLIRGIVSVSTATTLGFSYTQDDSARVYVDGVALASSAGCGNPGTVTVALSAGSHIIDFLLYEHTGGDGIRSLTPTITSQVDTLYPPLRVTLASEGTTTALVDAQTAQATADAAKANASTAQTAADAAKILAAEAGRSAINRVTNPGAEADFDGWSKGGTIANLSIVTDKKRSGSKSFKFTGTGMSELTQPEFAVTPGQIWRFSMWSQSEGAAGGLRLQKRGQTDTTWTVCASTTVSISTGWVESSCDYTVPASGVSHLRPRIAFDLPAGESVWIDDVSLKDVTDVVKLEAAAAQAQATADQAQSNALAAMDAYSRDASQGLEGITFESSSSGVQAVTTVEDAEGALRGKAIRKPASKAGSLWIHDTYGRIPLKRGVLYEVFATIRIPTQDPAPTGTVYVGVDGLKCVGSSWQWVNNAGSQNSTSQHYFGSAGGSPTVGNWVTYRGYFRAGTLADTSFGGYHGKPDSPGVVHPSATHVQPMVIMSYSGKADLVEISDWGITAVPQSTAQKAVEAQTTADKAVTDAATAKKAADDAQSTATTAKTLADQAKDDAASAAGIAGGKSDVVIQLDPPGTALRKATTLWIDTTGGANTPKKWSGSAWVAVTDKTATDAASAAVAAKTSAEKAQSTADTAKSNAATAQARADAAKAVADQAKLDAANIAVTVETVQSTISQLPSQIMTEVESKYVSTTSAQKTTEILRSEMSQTASGIDVRIKQTNEQVTSVSGAVVAERAAREALIRMGVNGVEVGTSDSPAKSVYGADGMKILVNGVEVANYKSTGAENSQMLIRDRLQIGNRIIEPNPNGGLWIRGA